MKLTAITSEAWRNLVTGTSRAAVFAISLALIVGVLCVSDARAVVSLLGAARTFQTSGASTIVLTAPHAVSGTRCEQLTHLAGVQAAGAIRQTTDLTTRALPDAPLPQWQATPGFTHVIAATTTGQPGILASEQVAAQLSLTPGDSLASDHGPLRIAGTYPYPDDGRLQTLTYAVIAPVPATGTFDACWARIWPPDALTSALTRTALNGRDGTDINLTQLNDRYGDAFDGRARFDQRPTRYADLAALIAALILGFVSIRLRRLELSSALHCGVHARALHAQTSLETLTWAAAGVVLCAPAVWIAATAGNPTDPTAVLLLQLRGLAAALLGTLVGATIATLTTRERHLFTYFKNR